MYVKPKNVGAIVRYPENPKQVLPEEGAEVPESQFWNRRVAQGDVVLASPPKPVTAKAADKKVSK